MHRRSGAPRGTAYCIWFALALTLLSPARAAEPPLAELEQAARAVLAEPDTIARRRSIAPVFQLADRYAALGESGKAMPLYTQALEVQPWNLRAQWAVARLLDAAGDTNAARLKATLVWENAETDDLLAPAAVRLGRPFPKELPTVATPPSHGVCLVPIGTTDNWLLLQLRDDLSRITGVPVVIRTAQFTVPPADRDPLHARAEDLRGRIVASLKDGRFKVMAARLGLSTNTLADDEAVFAFTAQMLSAEPDKETARQFAEELAFLRRLGPQWEGGSLASLVAKAAGAQPGSRVGYLGVTRMDLFSGNSRFAFGVASVNANSGVLSYRRFMGSVTDTAPNRRRLAERALKQALSSTGLMFGLARCTDPQCARAYANNLDEHDAKKAKFCADCRETFAKRLPAATQ